MSSLNQLLEPGRLNTLVRRSISIPTVFLGLVVGLAAIPILVPALAILDLIRDWKGERLYRPRWLTLRALAFVLAYLACESAGIVVAFALWIFTGFGQARRLFLNLNFRLQVAWATTLKSAVMKIYGMTERIVGLEEIGPGPMLVFIRHSSLADTVLPASYLSGLKGVRLRWVLKRPLLWDPCLDIVGNRLPNCFVRRGPNTSSEEIAHVGNLGRGLRAQDGVLIYPEGTRFTQAKRLRRIKDLEARGSQDHADRARRLLNTLLPEVDGALALLRATDDSPVEVRPVFCSHYGFEEAVSLRNVLDGALLDRSFATRFWKFDRRQIPGDEEDRVEWLYDEWERVERWVADH